MKIDGARIINDFIEPNKRQYSIPVYQRNYEWSRDQCEKLFEDILLAFKRDKQHFCGAIVYAPLKTEKNIQYFVIVDIHPSQGPDRQRRICKRKGDAGGDRF